MKTDLIVALGDQLLAVERPWQHLPAGFTWGQVGGVAVDSRDRLYVSQRVGPPVVVLDEGGAFVTAWGEGVIHDAHGIAVGPRDEVVVVDRDAHQVIVFDTDGNEQLRLGTQHRPALQAPFNHPTDAAIAEDGDIYVADGYGNSCVHRFSADGAHLSTWGRPGTGDGEFTTPHAVWVDGDRVLVADRENDRVQVFDREGTFLEAWHDFHRPMGLYVDRAGMTYVTDQIPRLSMLTRDGTLVGRCRPVLYTPHAVWGDSQGNLYLADVGQGLDRVTRLTVLPA
jgi:DNA-binding beta-propeller fold protein YncE